MPDMKHRLEAPPRIPSLLKAMARSISAETFIDRPLQPSLYSNSGLLNSRTVEGLYP